MDKVRETLLKKEISDALTWYKVNRINAYTHDGSIYVLLGRVDVMVSDAEVSYRADLYRSLDVVEPYKVKYNSYHDVKKGIEYYQKNLNEFFIHCLGGDPKVREYVYDEWIETFFLSSYVDAIKDYFLNIGVPEYDEEPFISYTDEDWIDWAEESELILTSDEVQK